MSSKPIVYVQFPKTGLGNMLLVWARGLVFAKQHGYRLVTSSWWGLRPGVFMRRERKKRIYWNYFKQSPLLLRMYAFCLVRFGQAVEEQSATSGGIRPKSSVILFNTVMTDYDLFAVLRPHQAMIRETLYASLHPKQLAAIAKLEAPVIGIHVRRGDFKLGSLITPLSFFIDGITAVRKAVKADWPVTIFTDGTPDELSGLLALPNVRLAVSYSDITDILMLSRSRVLLLSAGSTFSYWSAFLSNAVVIRPADDWLGIIRTTTACGDDQYTELKWANEAPDAGANLLQQLRAAQLITTQ